MPIQIDTLRTSCRIWQKNLLSPGWVQVYTAIWLPFALFVVVFRLWTETQVGLTDGQGYAFGTDFLSFWTAAKLVLQGHSDAIYNVEAFHAAQLITANAPLVMYKFNYPPPALILLAPIGLLPYLPGYAVWTFGGIAGYLWIIWLAGRSRPALLLALAAPALFFNVFSGQTGVLTLMSLGGGLYLLPRRPVLAGAILALQIYKPHFAPLVPVALIFGREWRAFVAWGAAIAILCAASLWFWGLSLWSAYFVHTNAVRTEYLQFGEGLMSWMPTLFVLLKQLHVPIAVCYGMQAAAGLLVAAAVGWSWSTGLDWDQRRVILIVGTLLVSPYMLNYDLVPATLAIVWLADRYKTLVGWSWAIAAFGIVPIIGTFSAKAFGANVGCLPIWAIFVLILIETAKPRERSSAKALPGPFEPTAASAPARHTSPML